MIEVHVDAADAVRRLTALGAAVDGRVMMDLVGQRVVAWIDQNFRAGGLERPWAPLSPNTVAARRKGRGAGTAQPLRDTGRMAQSFVPGAPDSAYALGVNDVTVGTNDQKAVFHQFGTRPYVIRPKARKFLRFITAAPQGAGRGKPRKARRGFYAFAREVHHPGIPARPMLPSEPLARQLAEDTLQAYVDEVVRRRG